MFGKMDKIKPANLAIVRKKCDKPIVPLPNVYRYFSEDLILTILNEVPMNSRKHFPYTRYNTIQYSYM